MKPHSDSIPLIIERHSLANGLDVVLQPDDALPLVAVNLWYHVGSRNERPGGTGFAHLFEHMLFQGSQNIGTNEHFRWVQQVGGVANGSTWFDRTNYYETVPAHQLDLALWLESDRMGFLLPALSSEKLENQREVVMNERRQRVENQPYGRAFERLHEMLYPAGHPYSWPVIGYMDDIEAMTLADVQGFFTRHYRPGNAVLTLAGDFESERALASVERFFGDIPAGATTAEEIPDAGDWETPVPETGSSEIQEDDVELSRVYLAWRLPAYGTPAWYAADLLTSVLSGGKTSPLYRDLVYSRRLAKDVSAFVLPTEMEATLALVATATPGTEPADLEAALVDHLTRAAAGLLDTAEIERARNRIVTAALEGLQHLDRRADLISQFTTYFDEPERLLLEVERYISLPATALSEVAAEHIQPDRRTVLHVVPRAA